MTWLTIATAMSISLAVFFQAPSVGLYCASACLVLPQVRQSTRTLWLRLLRYVRMVLKEPPPAVGIIGFNSESGFEWIELLAQWRGTRVFSREYDFGDDARLNKTLLNYHSMSAIDRNDGLQFVRTVLRRKAELGRMPDLVQSPSASIRLLVAPYALEIHTALGKKYALADLTLSDFSRNFIVYLLSDGALDLDKFKKHIGHFERLMGGQVTMRYLDDFSGAVYVRRLPDLPAIIRLRDVDLVPGEILFGIDLITGDPIRVPFDELKHILITGTTGGGKSVFMHQLVSQFIGFGSDVISEMVLIDMKGGIEFRRYAKRDPRFKIAWDFDQVEKIIKERTDVMMHNFKNDITPKGRIIVIIDEFAELEKRTDLLDNLSRMSRLGRSAGVRLICATQKPTTDAMPSAIRGNLTYKVCFNVTAEITASGIFGNLKALKLDPTKLRTGQCIIESPFHGCRHYVKATMSDLA